MVTTQNYKHSYHIRWYSITSCLLQSKAKLTIRKPFLSDLYFTTLYMVRTTSAKQTSRTFQGCFKDKLQFSRTTIYLINWHSLTPFDHPIGVSHLWLLLLQPSLITLFLYYFLQHKLTKWLGMTCNCIWVTEMAFEIKKQKLNIVDAQKCFYNTREF